MADEMEQVVGITPYMRCTMCRRVLRLHTVEMHHGCICGQSQFVNVVPTRWERFVCWLFRR